MAKVIAKALSKREIASRIYLTGTAGAYTLITGNIGNLERNIYLDSAKVGFAMQRALRRVAAENPGLFPQD